MDAPRTNWWDDDPEIAHKSLFALCNNLEQEQQGRLAEWLHFTRLYSNKSNNLERNQFLPPGAGGFDMVRLNVVASITDTMVAKLTQDNPALMFLTSNAYETQQQMAEQLGTWSDGVIYENKFYRTAPKILRDAIIYGTGLNVVSRTRQNKIKFTRGFCANFIVDDTTAEEDDPQELYAKKLCARASLLNEFRDDKAAIESINSSNPAKNEYNASSWVPDRLLVRESWHLPWFDDDGEPHDGKHILAVEGGTLLSEEWKKPYFPVVRMHFKEPILGWWGGSLPGDIDGIQLQINKLLKFINMSQHLGSNLRVLVDTAADIVGAHLDNQIGTIVKYSSLKGGRPPEWTTPQAWHPQVYEYLFRLKDQAYEMAGMSQLSASSKKPAGLDSRVALREAQDIESERFDEVEKSYNQMFVDSIEMAIDFAKDIAEEGGSYKVRVPNKKRNMVQEVDFNDVDLKERPYIQIFPVSQMPRRPEGKLDMATDLVQGGFIDKSVGLKLMGFPDLDREMALATAATEFVDLCAEKILTNGEVIKPDPVVGDPKPLAARMGLYYARARINDVDETKLELMRQWIESCMEIDQANQPPPAMPTQGPPGMQPGAQPVLPQQPSPPPPGAPP